MRRLVPMALMMAGLAFWPAAGAAAEREESTVVKTKDGLKFTVPPDWPVEKRDGVVGPVPIEEYLAMKFSAIDRKLQGLEKKIAAMDLQLRALEEESKRQKKLKSSGELSAASP